MSFFKSVKQIRQTRDIFCPTLIGAEITVTERLRQTRWKLAVPLRDSSASFKGRSPGFTPAGEPRMSGRAFLLPERPEEAKSKTGSTSVISGPLRKIKRKQKQAFKPELINSRAVLKV